MKLIKYGLFIAFGFFLSCSSNQPTDNKVKNGYNVELATKLNADQYGMSKYVMAFLKRGPVRSQDSITAAELQKAHLENIESLADVGKLVLAGPFFDDGEIRGIYIFNVETIEEAKALTETDPAIKAGRLVMELHPWYGSAALKQVNEIHKSLQKQNVSEQ
ncbi:YciI family protein [Marinifilum flexuosum]|uniref:Uncharacterized protein YciI n=1 Tax=Marinifilum flexuosum TaxID=1117708 RepID=A0A419WSR6_9BACT|nr:YciI family protein [Marinifilum flexuosum]RKD98485.1 uncharacterized protein YciI [Marinifilum flexuosum]